MQRITLRELLRVTSLEGKYCHGHAHEGGGKKNETRRSFRLEIFYTLQ
jgi:hypothetical protein